MPDEACRPQGAVVAAPALAPRASCCPPANGRPAGKSSHDRVVFTVNKACVIQTLQM